MRVAKASVELATAPQFDEVIKNYDLDVALKEAHHLVANYVGASVGDE
jgi:guanylate kinase